MGRTASLAALALLLACADAPITQGDASMPNATDAQSGDAGAPPLPELTCACDQDEDCPACFERLGACCYGDPSFGGQVEGIVRSCEGRPACKACCKECAALSCEEIKVRDSCPNLIRE